MSRPFSRYLAREFELIAIILGLEHSLNITAFDWILSPEIDNRCFNAALMYGFILHGVQNYQRLDFQC